MARVLLAESDRRIRDFIAGILADCGHEVQACDDSIEASVRLATGPIDILVTDIVLRDSRGPSLGRCCAALGIPAVTLTGREFDVDGADAERPPPLLEKPFRFADLQSVLDAVAVYSRSTQACRAA
jgi:CheY-like chemotaxis protein